MKTFIVFSLLIIGMIVVTFVMIGILVKILIKKYRNGERIEDL